MKPDPQTTNVERLKKNLKSGTLAAQLVGAYETATSEGRSAALQAIVQARLDQVRTSLESPKA
jgi:hypothetical protein